MRVTLVAYITLALMTICMIVQGQDSLMLKSGKMVPFLKLYQYKDSIELKVPYSRERIMYATEDVFGFHDVLNERSYYLLIDPENEGGDEPNYIFLERTQVGAIDMYVDNSRDYKMYLSKNNENYLIYRTLEPYATNRDRIDILRQLVMDDKESIKYINSQKFKFKPREIELVVNQYNQRNFASDSSSHKNTTKQIFLYRTQFQKTKAPVKVWYNGIPHSLYIKDFIQLDIPVQHPAEITISDGLVSTGKIISASLGQQYFEVLYDPTTNSYILEPKTGTELHFEFNKIKERVEEKASN